MCKWDYNLLCKVVISFESGKVIWKVRAMALHLLFIAVYHCFRAVPGTQLVYGLPVAVVPCNNSQNFNAAQ